jgi:hypothetical protein
MPHVQFFGICLHVCDKFFQVFWWKFLPRYNQQRSLHSQTDRLEVDIRFVGELGVEPDRDGVRSDVAHFNGVTVGSGAHGSDRARGASSAREILDDELLSERARHVLAGHARRNVGSSARGKRHNYRDCPRWVGLRSDSEWRRRQRGGTCRQL